MPAPGTADDRQGYERAAMPTVPRADATAPERRRQGWWVWEDSNLRPYAYQAYALTT